MSLAALVTLVPVPTLIADLSRAASGGLVAAIWQGVLLAGLAALALHLLPRTPAAVRFAVWFAVFLLVAALPFVSLNAHAAAAAQAGSHAAWFTVDARWTLAIVAVWALASLVRTGTLIAAAVRVRTLWRRATPLQDAAPAAGSRHAQVCTSNDVDRPTVIGFFSPKILIPTWLLEKLTPAELEQVVLHEAGHLGRADDWMNLLQKIALVVFPLNPALAWVERRLCFERELACDERVLHALRERASATTGYASCLATLAEYRLERRGRVVREAVRNLALALGALGRESELGRRVGRILRPAAQMRPLHARLVMGGAMLGLLVAATGLEHCPRLVAFASPQTAISAQAVAQAAFASPRAPRSQAVNVSLRLPAERAQTWKAVGEKTVADAAPQIQMMTAAKTPAAGGENSAAAERYNRSVTARALSVSPATPAVVEVRAHVAREASPDAGYVVTRWVVTTWQSSDGSRMVQTSAEISNSAAAPQQSRRQHSTDFTQEASPYAAVPVPGGWLIFQL